MAEKFLSGIRPLEQFMEDGSFLMPEIPAVLRALQAIHAPDEVDYDYLLSISGMAVRLAWQPGWAEYQGLPNQGVFYNQGGKHIVELALERAGVRFAEHRLSESSKEAAWDEICRSLNRGVPVLLEEPSCVWAAVLGYRENELFGVSVFADPGRRLADPPYNPLENWGNGTRYLLIEGYQPRPMEPKLLREVLETAVYQARTSRLDCLGDTALGISAFDALAEMLVWDESFAPLEPGKEYDGPLDFPYERPEGYYRTDGAGSLDKRFWSGYCDFLCMLNGFENFSRFLLKYADIVPQWKETLQKAAQYYGQAAAFSGALWQYVTPDAAGAAKFKEAGTRYAFAAHMLRAKIYTIRAVELLEKVLADPAGKQGCQNNF